MSRYIVAGVPDTALCEQAIAASENIASCPAIRKAVGRAAVCLSGKPAGPHPHLTFVQLETTEHVIRELTTRLRETVAGYTGLPALHAVEFGGGHRFVNIQYRDDRQLGGLRRAVWKEVQALSVDVAPEQAALRIRLTDIQRLGELQPQQAAVLDNMRTYGYRDLHMTLTGFTGQEALDLPQQALIQDAAGPLFSYDGNLVAVATYAMGENGTCVGEPLARIALGS